MNFELISPVGADVDSMPMTLPDQTTGTSVSTPTPRRHVHRLLFPHCIIHFGTRLQYTNDLLGRGKVFSLQGRTHCFTCAPEFFSSDLCLFLFFFPWLFDRRLCSLSAAFISEQRSTFTATYSTQHIITITIPNAAGCGR